MAPPTAEVYDMRKTKHPPDKVNVVHLSAASADDLTAITVTMKEVLRAITSFDLMTCWNKITTGLKAVGIDVQGRTSRQRSGMLLDACERGKKSTPASGTGEKVEELHKLLVKMQNCARTSRRRRLRPQREQGPVSRSKTRHEKRRRFGKGSFKMVRRFGMHRWRPLSGENVSTVIILTLSERSVD